MSEIAELKAAAKEYMAAVAALVSHAPSGKLWCELKLLGDMTEQENEEANEALERWQTLDRTGKTLSQAIEEA